jgi:hypothetical protein
MPCFPPIGSRLPNAPERPRIDKPHFKGNHTRDPYRRLWGILGAFLAMSQNETRGEIPPLNADFRGLRVPATRWGGKCTIWTLPIGVQMLF